MPEKKVLFKGIKYTPCAVDIGNSRIKIRVMDDLFAQDHEVVSELKLVNFLESHEIEKLLLAYSSVNKYALSRLEGILSNLENIELIDIGPFLKAQDIINFENIQGIGADRALGLIGALTEYKPPLITVDCGTAITVNVLDKDRVCRGGAIFAGIYTQIKALADHADGLELTEMGIVGKAAGKNTDEALNSGIVLGAAGAVKQIYERIISEEFKGKQVKIILTGGYPELLQSSLKNLELDAELSKNLVLKGILSLVPGKIE